MARYENQINSFERGGGGDEWCEKIGFRIVAL